MSATDWQAKFLVLSAAQTRELNLPIVWVIASTTANRCMDSPFIPGLCVIASIDARMTRPIH